MVGYEFDELRIEPGESKTFELVNGIPGGNNAVNVRAWVNVGYIIPGYEANFENGQTTTLTLARCNDADHCYGGWWDTRESQ